MAISRRRFLATAAAVGAAGAAGAASAATPSRAAIPNGNSATGAQDRVYWVTLAEKLARPVLNALAAGKLDEMLRTRKDARPGRAAFAPLEALGRLMAGISAWLESGASDGPEAKARADIAQLARDGIRLATDPALNTFMHFDQVGSGTQPLVDAAFLAHGLVRAPRELAGKLDGKTRANVVAALARTRAIKPNMSNWLLFSAMIEAGLSILGEEIRTEPVDTALTKHQEWYKGDGTYGDGPNFHWDYYNSFVIQPMLVDVLETLGSKKESWAAMKPAVLKRAARYAAIQERLISPEGTYPIIGRSLTYRFGMLQHLGQMALRKELPAGLAPAQVRCAMTAVIRRIAEFNGPSGSMFDGDGFLTMGICGRQAALAENYISPGSLYLCATGLLPLGLGPNEEFWTAAAMDWTSRKVWNGAEVPIDHAVD